MATLMGTGVGKGKSAWESGQDAARAALAGIGAASPDLVIVFISPEYDYQEALKGILSLTGGAPLIGCSSAGEFTERGVQSQSVVVAAIASDAMRFAIGRGDKRFEADRAGGAGSSPVRPGRI